MMNKIKRRIDVLKFIWNQYQWKTIFLSIISLLNLLIQLSTVAFLLPIIDFMRNNGEINLTQGYWKYVNVLFTSINVSLSFKNILIASFISMCLYQIFNYLRLVYSSKIRAEFHCIFQENISKSIFYGNYASVTLHRQSSLINILLHQTNQAAYFIFALFQYLYVILQLFLYVSFLILLSLNLTILVALYVLIQVCFVNWRSLIIKSLGQQLSKDSDRVSHHIQEYTSSLKFITILKLQKRVTTVLYHAFNSHKNTFIKTEDKRSQIAVSHETMHMGFIFIMMYFSYSIWNIELAKIMVFMFMLTRLIPTLKSYNDYNATLNTYYAYFNKLKQFILDNPVDKSINNKAIKQNSLSCIIVNNVSFSYRDDKPVLSNINYTFKKGSITAISGESGTGKTTLIDLILGLQTAKSGNIDYINQDTKLKPTHFSRFYLPQVPIVLAGTLRNYFTQLHTQTITDQQIITSLKKVNLWKHFDALNGLDSLIDEKGSNLSEGQKQRLCLANIFLNRYDLIILDEFTSAIDQESKEIIINAMNQFKDTIIIFITHDKDTVECASDKLYLYKGKIKQNER